MMGMIAFHQLIPEVGLRETRTALVPPGQPDLPADNYGFMELYCVDPKCDCRRVVINVLSERGGAVHLATINHAFEPPKRGALVPEQTFLDPINPQSDCSEALLGLFEQLLGDEAYRQRLEQHYQLVKAALKDPAHPIHAVIASADGAVAPRGRAEQRVEPYAPCPCGSGEKYKFCCRDRRQPR